MRILVTGGSGNDARDVAQAFVKACERPGLKREVFFISAKDNGTRISAPELVKRFFPEVESRPNLSGSISMIDYRRAERLIGYEPEHSWREWFPELA